MDVLLHQEPFATTDCTRLTNRPSLARYEDSSVEHFGQRNPRFAVTHLQSVLPKLNQWAVPMHIGGLALRPKLIPRSATNPIG